MPTRTKPHNTYAHGQWLVICDVCGFRFHACDVKKRWDGFMVCADDWEKRHPSDFFKAPKENTGVPFVRADGEESGSVDINGNTFPPATPYFINFTVEVI